MEKCSINRELFLSYFQCKRKVHELANNLDARKFNENYGEKYNTIAFKQKASEIIIAEEKASAKKIIKDKTFKSKEGEEVTIDLIIEYQKENVILEFLPKTIKYIGPEKWWIAYKVSILKKCNYKVDKVLIVCYDWQCPPNTYDRNFLYIEEIQNSVQRLINSIPQKLIYIENSILDNNLLNKEIGQYCTDPFECQLKEICWKKINAEKTIFDLREFTSRQKFILYWQDYFMLNEFPAAKAIKNDRKRLKSINEGKEIINYEKLLGTFSIINTEGNAYFLSIEYFKNIIQNIDIPPYKSIPYQFSTIFVDYRNKTSSQKQKVSKPEEDMNLFLSELISTLNLHKASPIVVFNANIIKNCLKNLVIGYPQFETSIKEILDRLIDLRACFEHLHYYHPEFKGSLKLKDIASILNGDLISQSEMLILKSTNSINEYYKWIMNIDDHKMSKKMIKNYSLIKVKNIQYITKFLLDLIVSKH